MFARRARRTPFDKLRLMGSFSRRRHPEPVEGHEPAEGGAPAASAHHFADVAVRGALPVRFGLGRTQADDAPRAEVDDREGLVLWQLSPSLDLLDEREETSRVVAVKALDLGLEPYRTADGIVQALTPFVDRLGDLLQRAHGTHHVLHLELSGEPTKDQLEGLARLRDHLRTRRREAGIALELRVAAPSGQPELRAPKP
ncbi:MAG: hypothetical protein JO164_10780 [Candidatus Eremiobacteraeota bacterium]|nr:hypothetical protein [Candidatus Eremiobacteraeota bacterium]